MKCIFCSNFISVWFLNPIIWGGGGVQLPHFLPLPRVRDGLVERKDPDSEVTGSRADAGRARLNARLASGAHTITPCFLKKRRFVGDDGVQCKDV